MRCISFCFFGFLCYATISFGQVFDERFDDWPVDLKINGRVFATDSMTGLTAIASLRNRSSDPSVAELVGNVAWSPELTQQLESLGLIIQPPPKENLSLSEQSQQPSEGGQTSAGERASKTIVWYDSREPNLIPEIERVQLEETMRRCIVNGGTLFAIGPQIPLLGKWYVPASANEPGEKSGFNLLPDCILTHEPEGTLDTSSDQSRIASLPRLTHFLAAHPQCVDVCLQPNTVLVLQGRKMQVIGDGQAVIRLAGQNSSERVQQLIRAPQSPIESPAKWLIDLTQWRRRAIETTLPPFPPDHPSVPNVPSGTLIIVGGGGMPIGLMDRFVELAGGAENAKLVYVPCEEADDVAPQQSMVETWRKMGVAKASFIHTKDRVRANEDESFYAPLKDATGIWFGGGRQWNFADSYYGTQTHRCMKEVLARGGVIGGSSAGASIQARYLARATPIENFDIMAPGYERGGLGFIGGVAIDQHFSQRGRHADMTQLVARYPQLLGIGIDEATAIIVHQSIAKVVGSGRVHFYDSKRKPAEGEPDYQALEANETFDLAKRKIIR